MMFVSVQTLDPFNPLTMQAVELVKIALQKKNF